MFHVDETRLRQIAERYGLDLIVVFGSQVTGRARPGSDIDLAVRWVHRPWNDPDRELALVGELTEAVWGRGDLDVSFVNGADPLFLFEVASDGQALYERQPVDFIEFQSYAARRYYDAQKFFDRQWNDLKERVLT